METLAQVRMLVAARRVRVSDHGMDELLADGLSLKSILASLEQAEIVEDYPEAFKGPTVLALHLIDDFPVHVVWGLANKIPDVATLVTAYIPNPEKWYDGFKVRKPK